MKGKDMILLWLQNREHTWWNVTQNNPIRPIEDAIKRSWFKLKRLKTISKDGLQ